MSRAAAVVGKRMDPSEIRPNNTTPQPHIRNVPAIVVSRLPLGMAPVSIVRFHSAGLGFGLVRRGGQGEPGL